MTGDVSGTRASVDVRLCALLLGGAGLVFLAESLVRVGSEGAGILTLPIIAFVLDAASAAVVLAGLRWGRPPVLVIALLGALLHMVIMLGGGPVWARVISGVLAAALVYAVVVLNTKPVREHFGLVS